MALRSGFGFLAFVLFTTSLRAAECPPCADDQCLTDPAVRPAVGPTVQKMLDVKKAALRKVGYPARLVELLDRVSKCVQCVSAAPDGFHALIVNLDTSTVSKPYSPYLERRLREQLTEGRIKAFYLLNASEACGCCNEPGAHERTDWNASLGINTGLAIEFKDAESLGTIPPDLREPFPVDAPPAWEPPVPPPLPRVSAQCPESDKAEQEVNDTSFAIDELEAKVSKATLAVELARRVVVRANYENLEHPGPPTLRVAEAKETILEEAQNTLEDLRAQRATKKQELVASRKKFFASQDEKCNTRKLTLEAAGGASVGLSFAPSLGSARIGVHYRITPDNHGALTAAVLVQGGTRWSELLIPVGFQYEFRLAALPGFFIYARGSLGYAVQFQSGSLGNADQTFHSVLVMPEAGAGYYFARLFSVGIEPISFPVLIFPNPVMVDNQRNNVSVSWRPLVFFAVHLF